MTMALRSVEPMRLAGAHVRADQQLRLSRLVRENARLSEEIEHLRCRCADLAASAELWINLYEAALTRIGQPGCETRTLEPDRSSDASIRNTDRIHETGG
jgi:hypothetical protein